MPSVPIYSPFLYSITPALTFLLIITILIPPLTYLFPLPPLKSYLPYPSSFLSFIFTPFTYLPLLPFYPSLFYFFLFKHTPDISFILLFSLKLLYLTSYPLSIYSYITILFYYPCL
jgi:hypothetical protein